MSEPTTAEQRENCPNTSRQAEPIFLRFGLVFLLTTALLGGAQAQTSGSVPDAVSVGKVSAAPAAGSDEAVGETRDGEKNPANYVRALARDQWAIWTAPLHLQSEQLPWLVGAAAALTVTTSADRDIQQHVSQRHAASSRTASNVGLALFGATAATMYAAGARNHDSQLHETGLLAAEAGLNAWGTNSALQAMFGRLGPNQRRGGEFFAGGDSFPSNHAAVAWSMASVIAHEYPGWGTQALAYGSASAISAARVAGDRHYFSDVAVGGALGWLIGRQIYDRRHDQSFPHENYGTFLQGDYDRAQDALDQASPYVPLESWTYAAMDRLASLGQVPAGFQNMRPWTRLEFARLLQESRAAQEEADETEAQSTESDPLYRALTREFASETEVLRTGRNRQAQVESVYVRAMGITGQPLTDEMHFAATVADDYGRPFREGFNAITGASLHAEAGVWSIYVRGEYQHAPEASVSVPARQAIAIRENLPVQPGTTVGQTDRFRLLDSYVALNLHGWQASFGKQSLWWGPGYGTDLTFTNNAEPLPMLRLNSVTPFQLPWLLKALGEMRAEGFLGQLDGYHFVRMTNKFVATGDWQHLVDPQPYIWGAKLALHLTENLEIGVSDTTIFAGKGRPLTFDTFLHTFSSSGNAQDTEPGDRRTGFDFRYRLPWLRRWLVLYDGALCEDEFNPIAYPRRAAMNPGIYLTQFPHFHQLDLRFESGYTDLPIYPYLNAHYAGGFTNDGKIMGSWIGPQARAYQAMSTYWLENAGRVQLGYRRQEVDPSYLGGGVLNDVRVGVELRPRADLSVSSFVQFERWNFPVMSAQSQTNAALSVQVTYWPGQRSEKGRL